MDATNFLGMVTWPSQQGSLADDPEATDVSGWMGTVGMKKQRQDPWGVLESEASKSRRDEDALGYDEDPRLSINLQVEARPLKSSECKRPLVPRLKLPPPSGTPSRSSFRDMITPSWWEAKPNKIVFGSQARSGAVSSGHSTPGDPSWHTFSDLRPGARFRPHGLKASTARERRAPPAWDVVGNAPKTGRNKLNTAPADIHQRPDVTADDHHTPLTSVRLKEVPLHAYDVKENDVGGTVRDQLLSGYRHPYGLSFHEGSPRCPFAPPASASSGLFPATPRSQLTGRSHTAAGRTSSKDSSIDDVSTGTLLSSRRLTNTAVARTRVLLKVKEAERRAVRKDLFEETERRARISWMPPAAAVDLREIARRNKTLSAIERMLHLSSQAGRGELHALFYQFCGSETDDPGEADHVEGLLDLMVELEILSLVDVRTGLRVRQREEGRQLRREDGLLPRSELLEVVQGVMAGLGQQSYRLPEEDLARCLQILADRALYRAGTVAHEAEQARRRVERAQHGTEHHQPAASAERETEERRIGMVGRSGQLGRRRQPGPCRGKPQRLVEAARLNLRGTQPDPDTYTIRLWH